MTLGRSTIFFLVLVVWAGIYLPSLGTTEFKGEEGRRVLPAVTMLRSGNWIVPSIGGQDYYSKPPGINWLVALSFVLTGHQSEFTARLPSVLFVLLFVSLLVLMPSRLLSPRARLLAAVIFLTNISMIEKGRLIEIEAVYVSLAGISFLWWLNSWSQGGSKWSLWIIPSLVLAYGMLVKGPFIIFFFYCMVAGVLLYEKKFKELFSIQHILGACIIVFIFLGWFYLAYQQSEGSRMTGQMTGQLLTRIIRKLNFVRLAETTLRALANFLPWLIFVPAMWNKKLLSLVQKPHLSLFKGCRLGLVISFFAIALLPGGQSRYTMPAIPLACLLLGWIFSLQSYFDVGDKIWKTVLLFFFVILPFASIAGLIFVSRIPAAFVVNALALFMAVLVLLKRFWINSVFRLILTTTLLIVLVMLQFSVFGTSIIKRYGYRRPAAMEVNKIVPSGETIYVLKPGYQPFLFYVRPPLKYLLQDSQIDNNVHYILLEKQNLEALRSNPQFASRSPQVLYELHKQIRDSYYSLVKLN